MIQEESHIRKLKRKANKRLHKEISCGGVGMEIKVNDASQNAVKRARMLEMDGAVGTSS